MEIPVLLCHYWKQNLKTTEAAKKICEVEGEDVISNHTAQNWLKTFIDGDTSLEDEPRSGSPVTLDSEALREAAGTNPANQHSPIVRGTRHSTDVSFSASSSTRQGQETLSRSAA
jgi:transposase